MRLRKVALDTNLYVDWLNRGLRAPWMLGPGLVRYLVAVVVMELRVGAMTLRAKRSLDGLVRAYQGAGRLVEPDAHVFDRAGGVLRELRESGREIRRASIVNDVLIALTAKSIGATVVTADADYHAIRAAVAFELEVVEPLPA
jgi:predicted nucleic acid-binding protein